MDESDTRAVGSADAASEIAAARQAWLISRYNNRLGYLLLNFASCRAVIGARLNFNDSLKAGAQSLNLRAKRKPARRLVDFELELLINVRATELAKKRGSNSGKPNQDDINTASSEIIASVKPRRGRPTDTLLKHHVHALMVLHHETCGKPLRAGTTRNGYYAPHIKSPMEDTILSLFKRIDPTVTIAALADIIFKADRSKAVVGKRFDDFFPFHGGSLDAETGMPVPAPGYCLERFVRLAPIYSS